MEQLKQKGMYKVEEEKHDGKWVISASLVMPTIEAETDKGWISVEDRLPEYDKTVLVVNEDGYMHTTERGIVMDEYISREEAVKRIKSCISTSHDAWESGYNTAMAEIMEWIKHMPTADVQPVKHGHWVEKEAYEEDRQMGFNFQIVCSNCDEQNSVLYFDENSEPTEKYFMRTPWCPWCGARMDGDSDA